MALRRWWTLLAPGRTSSDSSRRPVHRTGPRLEALEDRAVPAVQLVSAVTGDGTTTANNTSTSHAIGSVSDDGRYVVYLSKATNLVAGQVDANAANDVFLFDKVTGTNTLISRAAGTTATASDGTSTVPYISGDGNWVAFFSDASNLVNGFSLPTGSYQLYLYDRAGGGVTLVTRRADDPTWGIMSDDIPQFGQLALSDDGRRVAYIADTYDKLVPGYSSSLAYDWVAGGYLPVDAYLYDRTTGTNSLVSHVVGNEARGGDDFTTLVNISGDGNKVVFGSYSRNLGHWESLSFSTSPDVFLYDVGTKGVTLVSHDVNDPTLSAASQSDQDWLPASISRDGRYVAYASRSRTLVSGVTDSSSFSYDAFLYDATTNTNAILSAAGTTAVGTLYDFYNRPAVNSDGTFVAFTSSGSNLVSGVTSGGNPNVYLQNIASGARTLVSHTAASATTPATGAKATVSDDGRYVSYISTTTVADVYRFDRTDGAVELISNSLASPTTPSGGVSDMPSISGDGTTIAWSSTATNLVANDANSKTDVFITGTPTDPTLYVTATSIDEGQQTTLTGTITDPSNPAALYTVTVDWGNGKETFQNVPVGKFSYDRRYYDDNPTATPKDNQDITVTAAPAAGAPLTKTATIEIRNVAPELSGVTVTNTTENGYVTLTGTFADVGTLDTHKMTVTWGDGKTDTINFNVGDPRDFSIQHKYLDDNPTGTNYDKYAVSVTVVDDDTGSDTEQVYATVTNAAPALSGVTVTSTVAENGSVLLTGTFTDAGTLDTHKLTVAWGDGKTDTVNFNPGDPRSFSLSHQYLDDNPTATPSDKYSVGVTIEDDDTGSEAATVYTTVTNVAPTLTGVAVTNTAENGTVTLAGTINDVGTLDSHKMTVTWGDGKSQTLTFNPGDSRTFSVTHQYLDDDPTGTSSDKYAVGLSVEDDDTGSGTAEVYATVTNAAPTLSDVTAVTTATAGQARLTGTFTDPGTLDTHRLTVTWGDGQTEIIDLTAGARSFDVLHQYPAGTPQGTYDVGVTLRDDDTGADTASAQVVFVINRPPVLTVAPTVSVPENTTAVTTATATDPDAGQTLTYSLTGTDAARLAIHPTTGVITFVSAPNYEAPADANADNVYTVTVNVSDGTVTDSRAVAVTVTNVNESPVLTVVPTVTVPENATGTVTTATAIDPDAGQTLTYSLTGTDADRLVINPSTGVITFAATPDFETPADADANNVYLVTVTVSDGNGGTDSRALAVTVSDVNETGTGVTIVRVGVNGGTTAPSPGVTFSRVNTLAVTFSTPVLGVDPGAFSLTRGTTTLTSGSGVTVSGLGTSTLTLSFTGSGGVESGSLADGIWTLTADMSKVQTGATLSRSRITIGNIRRLYGDADGDGTVTLTDFGRFGATFGRGTGSVGFNALLDYNGDGVVDLTDFAAFGQRFGKGI